MKSRRAADAGDRGSTEDHHAADERGEHRRYDRRARRVIGAWRIDFSMCDRRLSSVSLDEVRTVRVRADRREAGDGPGREGLRAPERDAEIGENDRDQPQTRMQPRTRAESGLTCSGRGRCGVVHGRRFFPAGLGRRQPIRLPSEWQPLHCREIGEGGRRCSAHRSVTEACGARSAPPRRPPPSDISLPWHHATAPERAAPSPPRPRARRRWRGPWSSRTPPTGRRRTASRASSCRTPGSR